MAGVEPALKWPNDLLVGGAKLAGVLAEAEFDGRRLEAVVVGIGINVAWPGPPEAGGTCLDDAGGAAQPVDKAVAARSACSRGWPPGARSSTTRPGGATWPTRCDGAAPRWASGSGSRSRADELTGVATAIDDAGHLVVETASGPRAVSAGDVVHLRPDE